MMKSRARNARVLTIGIVALMRIAPACFPQAPATTTGRQMECLGRGLVAIDQGGGKVFIGWRILGTDPDSIAFNVYRATDGAQALKINDRTLTGSTSFVDTSMNPAKPSAYFIRPVLDGRELEASPPFKLLADAPIRPYLSIPLRTPEGYSPNDASIGDLDGDGEYEIVLHQASNGRDNSQAGRTGEPILEAYKLDGTFL
jgi:rhamnogalacturonan endolyase